MNPKEFYEYIQSCMSIRTAQIPFESASTGMPMRASVIVVTYQRSEMLICTIEQLLKQDYRDFEIIVVDASPDAEECHRGLLSKHDSRLRYIVSSTSNICVLRNVGFLASTGGVVIYVDDDVFLDTDFVSRHVALHLSTKGRSVKLVSGHSIPSPLEQIDWVRNQVNYRPHGTWAKGVYGVNFSVKREFVIGCGGFNPYIPLVGDETEFFDRMISNSQEALNGKEVVVVHRAARTGGCRIQGKNPNRMAKIMSGRLLSRLSVRPRYHILWRLPIVVMRAIISKEIRHFCSKDGLATFTRDFAWYCISSLFGLKRRDKYFEVSLRLAKPAVLCGSPLPDCMDSKPEIK
jgi:glycosyltransferase involved in cell wall biosynthesis